MNVVAANATFSAETLLREAGLKRTPVRLAVLALLADVHAPLAAQQILDALPATTDSVTVYRTLNTLTEHRLLHRIRGDDRVWRYALSDGQPQSPRHDHAHFVCESCGSVECLRDVPIPRKLMQQVTPAEPYQVKYSEVLLHGLCPRCHS